MNNNICIETDKIQNILLKNFTEIKTNLNSFQTEFKKVYLLNNQSIKNEIDLLNKNLLTHINLTNEYINKLNKIKRDFSLLSDTYIKKIDTFEKINASCMLNDFK